MEQSAHHKQFHNWASGAFRLLLAIVIGTGALYRVPAFAYSINAPSISDLCTVSVLNRTSTIQEDGSFSIPNVPATSGFLRVRLNCPPIEFPFSGRQIATGQTAFFAPVANNVTSVGRLGYSRGQDTSIWLDISVPQTIASGLAEGKIQKAPRPTAMKYTVPINPSSGGVNRYLGASVDANGNICFTVGLPIPGPAATVSVPVVKFDTVDFN